MLNSIQRTNGRRISSTFLLIILALGFTSGLLVVVPSAQPAHAESLGQWVSTTSYPLNITSQSCVTPGGYVYCFGGQISSSDNATDATYYAPLSSSGIGAWASTTSFPGEGVSPVCTISSEYVYCFNTQSHLNQLYYAPLSSSGVGAWTGTTSLPSYNITASGMNFPAAVLPHSCVASQIYIYCIANIMPGGGPPFPPNDAVYFAPISSSGVGAWTSTTTYPNLAQGLSCAFSGDYIYCVGGTTNYSFDGHTTVDGDTNAVYYAQVQSSGGLGPWTSTASYPVPIDDQSCSIYSGYIQCVGGDELLGTSNEPGGPTDATYFAQILPASQGGGGLSNWVSTVSYPLSNWPSSCVIPSSSSSAVGGYVYCIGGETASSRGFSEVTSASYYSAISSQLPATSKLTVDTLGATGNAITGYYTLLYEQNGTLVSTGFSPATFTVNTGQAYTVAVDDYGPCQFWDWGDIYSPLTTGAYGTSNSTTVSIAGDVSITATLSPTDSTSNSTQPVSCGSTSSTVYIESVNQTGPATFGSGISGYYTVLYNADGSVVGTGFTWNEFQTTVGQTYSVQADSYGNCTFSKWSDGVTSNPRLFVATNGPLFLTAVYDCATPAT
jgi:hypothetical protein